VLITALRSAFPVPKNPSSRSRAVSPTAEQIPAPGKPLFQAAKANVTEEAVNTRNGDRGPLLLIAVRGQGL
jgi:hypothetical protein